jgi:hypothetical protein
VWAERYIEALLRGETVQFRPAGNSMSGRIEHRQLVTVKVPEEPLKVGDIVLCKVEGKHFVHLIKAIDESKERALIGNNRGHNNGWTSFRNIYGIVTKVEP